MTDNYDIVKDMQSYKELFWINDKYTGRYPGSEISWDEVKEASLRLKRFAPYIEKAFPETVQTNGIIESPLKELGRMRKYLEDRYDINIKGRTFLKCDSHLAVSGSVKARGGIYEILKLAEKIAVEKGMLSWEDDYSVLTEEPFRKLFSQYLSLIHI